MLRRQGAGGTYVDGWITEYCDEIIVNAVMNAGPVEATIPGRDGEACREEWVGAVISLTKAGGLNCLMFAEFGTKSAWGQRVLCIRCTFFYTVPSHPNPATRWASVPLLLCFQATSVSWSLGSNGQHTSQTRNWNCGGGKDCAAVALSIRLSVCAGGSHLVVETAPHLQVENPGSPYMYSSLETVQMGITQSVSSSHAAAMA